MNRNEGCPTLTGTDEIVEQIRERFEHLDEGREKAYVLSRQVVRVSSESIKNAHRKDFEAADKRLQDAALNFQEHIIAANRVRGSARVAWLRQADGDLDMVRLYLRLAARWEWLNDGQYRHVSLMVQEIGKMLGGWIKKPARKTRKFETWSGC